MRGTSTPLVLLLLLFTAGIIYVHIRHKRATPVESQIFFLQNKAREPLGMRTECSLESAAFFNPDRQVTIVFALPERERQSIQQLEELARLKAALPNLRWIRIDVDSFFGESPLEYWWVYQFEGASQFATYHMSDALRFLLLYRYGGLYLDVDVVSTRSAPSQPFLAYEVDNEYIMSAAIQLQRADEYTKGLVTLLPGSYDPNCWSCVGPTLVTRVHNQLRQYRTYKSSRFSPFHYSVAYDTLANPPTHNSISSFKRAHGIHLFSRMTSAIPPTRNNTLGYIFSKYCPLTYQRLEATGQLA